MMDLPTTPSFRLDNKRALITGASSGIGVGCAVALAEAGAHVVIAARRTDMLNDIVKALHDKNLSAESITLDISNIEQIAETIESQSRIDILVNSAGLGLHTSALDAKEDTFDSVMGVNVKGAYFLAQSVAKKLISEKRPGSIINISSQMAHVGGVDRSIYCASKHAVEGFTKAMAIEWGPHQIRINTICPTFIRTALTQATFDNPERLKWIKDKIKLGRVGEVEDIMGAVLFLASPASDLITGSSLLIDGGWTAG